MATRVLIVDDHPLTRGALSALLGQHDFSIVGEAAGGEEAIEVARALSARELEVLLLLDDHLSTDQIAARLFISEHTVRSHVKSLLRKLGVSSRRQALEALGVARN